MENRVMWEYIDTTKATINAIEDYKRMKRLEIITSSERNQTEIENISHFKFYKINEFLSWFEPAWISLPEEYQLILKEFYMNDNLKSGAGIKLEFKLGYSERQIHRLKSKAISDLSFFLYGK